MLSSRWPKSGWPTPSCRCIAAEVSPTLWPLIRAPAPSHRRTWSSWISYASSIVRSSYFSVSGSTGWRLVYAPSNIPAISSRDCSITSAPFTGPAVQALPIGPTPKLYAV